MCGGSESHIGEQDAMTGAVSWLGGDESCPTYPSPPNPAPQGSDPWARTSLVPELPCAPRGRWFHGKITREQAERLLYPPETGLFLVRESTNYPGDYTLCVSCEGKVEHYRIIYSSSKLSIDEEVYFENLMQLVEVRELPPLLVPSLGTIGLRLWGAVGSGAQKMARPSL